MSARELYGSANAVLARLTAEAPVLPYEVIVTCSPWSETAKISAYMHDDASQVEAWHKHFGGELTQRPHSSGSRTYWVARFEVDGVPVEAWTLLDSPPLPVRERHTEAEQAIFDRWEKKYGDQGQWSDEVRRAFANAVAYARAAGAL